MKSSEECTFLRFAEQHYFKGQLCKVLKITSETEKEDNSDGTEPTACLINTENVGIVIRVR